MKIRILIVGLLIALAQIVSPLVLSSTVYAVDIVPQGTAGNEGPCDNPRATERPSFCSDVDNSSENPLYGPNGIITKGVQLFVILVGFTAVIVIIISGYKFMTAQGDANSIAAARRGVIYAVIGLGIAALAQTIVSFVLRKLS